MRYTGLSAASYVERNLACLRVRDPSLTFQGCGGCALEQPVGCGTGAAVVYARSGRCSRSSPCWACLVHTGCIISSRCLHRQTITPIMTRSRSRLTVPSSSCGSTRPWQSTVWWSCPHGSPRSSASSHSHHDGSPQRLPTLPRLARLLRFSFQHCLSSNLTSSRPTRASWLAEGVVRAGGPSPLDWRHRRTASGPS